jgi:zinc protease
VTVTRIRLDNGLTILCEELHAAPVVAMQAWVHVGSADESDEIAGIAHVHEHMLFKGTSRRGVGEIARSVEGSGGEINAWTSFDQTVYHLVLESHELETGLDILADALSSSTFDAGELRREIEVVVEEIKRADDNPSRRVANALFALAFREHPYRRPVIGTTEAIRALTRERILDFYGRHYRPSAITLVLVGDFVTDEAVAEVRRAFGHWRVATGVPAAARPVEAEQGELRAKVMREPVKEARIAVAWHVPGLEHADIPAIDALSVILGHGESSRLYVETRRRRELVNDVYAYAYTPRDPGLMMLGAGCRSENLEPALASLLDQTYRLRHELVANEELEKAKVVILSEAAYQRETVQGQARKLGFFEVVAGDYAFEPAYYERLAALTPLQLREAARRHLNEHPSVVVQVPEEAGAVTETGVAALCQQAFARAQAPVWRRRARGPLDVTRVDLTNGACVLVRCEPGPVVAMRALALGGLRWESEANQGISHLFASLWGQATESLSPEAFAAAAARLGGHVSAFAGRNTIGIRGEFIQERASAGLELFVDAMLSRTIDPTDLERERAVVLERIRNREDNPAVVAFDLFARALFPHHPYGLRSIGTEETVQRLTFRDLLAYAEQYASGDKLVLAVVGDVDVDETIDLILGRLGRASSPALPPVPPPEAPPEVPRRERYPLDRKQAHVIVGAMGTTVEREDRYALEVLTTVLGGQSGRLFLDLRDRQSLAYAVSASSLEGLDPGHVMIHVGTSPDKVEQALAGVYGHLDRLRQEPVPAEELTRAQQYLVGTHSIDLQRAGARAMLMALGERFGLGYDQYTRYVAAVRAVTAADVQAVAERYLAPRLLVEAIVGP